MGLTWRIGDASSSSYTMSADAETIVMHDRWMAEMK